jgi:hypothetical protein
MLINLYSAIQHAILLLFKFNFKVTINKITGSITFEFIILNNVYIFKKCSINQQNAAFKNFKINKLFSK